MTTKTKDSTPNTSRSTSRLLAVQAIYEMDATGIAAGPVLREFAEKRWQDIFILEDEYGEAREPEKLKDANLQLMTTIVEGVSAHQQKLDQRINENLKGDWNTVRLEAVLRAILRAGAFELEHMVDVPARVVVNEYVEIADAFFDGSEVKLANAVLDKLARDLRPGEMSSA